MLPVEPQVPIFDSRFGQSFQVKKALVSVGVEEPMQ